MKYAFITLTLLALLSGPVLAPWPAAAQSGQLSVEFEQTPLFTDSNLMPGYEVNRWVKVTNTSQEPAELLLGAEHTDGCFDESDCLTRVLDLSITGAPEAHHSTMLEFMQNTVSLGVLEAGQSVTLDYSLTLNEETTNDFQAQNTKFTLMIGLAGTQDEIEVVTDDPNQPIATGRSTSGFIPLTISNERVESTDPDTESAIINWETSRPAYGWVIYGPEADSPYDLNLAQPPTFGYPLHTDPDTDRTTQHSVELTDLDLNNQAYRLRVVSQASPYIISEQEMVIDLSGTDETGPDPEAQPDSETTSAETDATPTDSTGPAVALAPTEFDTIETPAETETEEEPANDEDETTEEIDDELTDEQDTDTLAATVVGAVGGLFSGFSLYLLIFLLLVAAVLIYARRRQLATQEQQSSPPFGKK